MKQETNLCRYQVQEFAKKHREMDVAYYGKPYDEQDKYQLTLQGNREGMIQFISDLKQETPHPYIKFLDSLLEIHLGKVAKLPSKSKQQYALTLYHVGSRYGQTQELTGWLNWIEQKRNDYPELEVELRFAHVSTPDVFVLSL